MTKPLIFLEMNEVNFDLIQRYVARGALPTFARAIDLHGLQRTESEAEYEHLEPWIQWVTAHTGLTFAEHGVFRLGDIVSAPVEQIWERLEREGLRVAAISPINGANRTTRSPFWVPDPWVDTPVSGDPWLGRLTRAVKFAVNNNASDRLSGPSALGLLEGVVRTASPSSFIGYLRAGLGVVRRRHWSKAVILDQLLADTFVSNWRRFRPDFASVFLNSAAHIQHHYLFNSSVYDGSQRNPEWYVSRGADPLLEIYQLYDRVLRAVLKLDARVIVATGLTQLPYERTTFYYRLIEHGRFLDRAGIRYRRVQTRMSRDFLVECPDDIAASEAANRLSGFESPSGKQLFEVDKRGDSVFVTLVYPDEITSGFKVVDSNRNVVTDDLSKDVAFVAIKNGHHDGTGYLIDSDSRAGASRVLPLAKLHQLALDHFNVTAG